MTHRMDKWSLVLTSAVTALALISFVSFSAPVQADTVNCAPWADQEGVGPTCKSETGPYEECMDCVDTRCVQHAFGQYGGVQPETSECFLSCVDWASQWCENK